MNGGISRPGPVRKAASLAFARWIQWYWCDVPLAALIVVVVAVIPWVRDVVDLLGNLNLSDRRSIFTDLLNVTALFAGFTTLATATYLGWSSRGITAVRLLVGKDLLRLWLISTSLPWLCAVVLVIVKMTDRGADEPTNVMRWVAVGSMIVLAEQLARVLYLFYSLAMIEQQPRGPVRPVAPRPIGVRQPR
ncbi:hypothetical protein [Geodermatophilus amargosae]|uniref:hypothetical protein n=1 Tax=Geodermatophilus amargosae TaxID=1296565 RepID=UPI001114EA82|nr:hypothetical protein [Geodermatophilus amargosae]